MTSYDTKYHYQFLSDNKDMRIGSGQQVNSHYSSPPYYSQQRSPLSASPPIPFAYENHHTVISPLLTPAVSPVTSILTDSVNNNSDNGYPRSDKPDFSYISSNTNKHDPFTSYVCYGDSMFPNFGNSNISGSSSSSISSITSSAFHSPLTAPHSLQQQHKHICKFNHCGWSFKRYEHLKRHMLVHTGERPHMCRFPGCGKSFSRSDNFHAHYRTHAKKKALKKSGTKSCVTDDRTFHRGSAFSSLANQSQSQKKIINTQTSSIASKVAANAAVAVAVSQQFGQNNGAKNVYYNTNLYQQQPEMVDYLRSSAFHTSPTTTMMDFDCQVQAPNVSSASSPLTPYSSLLNHEPSSSPFFTTPSNTTSYPSSAPSLSYEYYSKKISKSQVSTTNPKSHTCLVSHCMRRFKRLEHLKRHMRIHTLERPFACTYPGCQKTFSRSDNLSQHVKTHQKREDKRRKRQQLEQQQQ